MGYMSPLSLEHIHSQGKCEGVCSLLVDPWGRVRCPIWSKKCKHDNKQKIKKLEYIASLRETTITTESASPKI